MDTSDPADARKVILGVAESDAHSVANHLIERQLREHGFTVVNLGACTPLSDFAAASAAHPDAEAILIGSLNGHAYEDLQGLPELRAAGLMPCPVIVGGNLSVGCRKDEADHLRLHELGVNHVLDDAGELVLLLDMLRAAPGVGSRHA